MKCLVKSLLIFQFFLVSCSCSNKSGDAAEEVIPLTDEQLLDKVQSDVFKYFWDYAEFNSKLARERYHTDETYVDVNLVTTGGSGFGLMTILVGIESTPSESGTALGLKRYLECYNEGPNFELTSNE